MPDKKYKYLTKDVPTGMCFNKVLGQIGRLVFSAAIANPWVEVKAMSDPLSWT